jgi:hypothetical protein
MKLKILFLKLAVCVMAIPVLALCIFGIPSLVKNPVSPEYANGIYPILTAIFISVIPYLFALYQAFKLLGYIGKNKAFTELSLKALKNIRYCGFAMSILYALAMPFLFIVAQKDDAPGLILMGAAIVCAPSVIAVFADILQKLLKEAIAVKSENERLRNLGESSNNNV